MKVTNQAILKVKVKLEVEMKLLKCILFGANLDRVLICFYSDTIMSYKFLL